MPLQKSNLPTKITYTQANGTQNVFIRGEILGSGSFSIVYRVTHQNTNKVYAMKVISTEDFSKDKLTLLDLENEIKIQKLVNHPNVIKLSFSFSDQQNHYFALEYCPGGNVKEYLRKNKHYRLSEPEIRKIIRDVIQGLVYIHGLKIIHHDIKLDNFVIDSNGNVKIADFGLSNFQKDENEKKSVIFGTLKYLSPEMLLKGSKMKSCKIDIWAAGVSVFYLLTGRYPFDGPSTDRIMKSIKRGEIRFPLNYPVSDEIKDFIRAMLQKDPAKRPTAKELLDHPFLRRIDEEAVCLYKPPNQLLVGEDVETVMRAVEKKQKDGREEEMKQKKGDSKPPACQKLGEEKQAGQRNQNENAKEGLCQLLSVGQVSQRQQAGDSKPSACQKLGEEKQACQRNQNERVKEELCQPLSGQRPVSQRQQAGDLKPTFCPPLGDKNQFSPRRPNEGLKATFSPLNVARPISQRQQAGDLKATFSPLSGARPVSQRQQAGDLKPTFCPPLGDQNQFSPRRPNEGLNPALCSPLNSPRPVSQRQQTGELKASLFQPLFGSKQVSPRRPNDSPKPSLCPPLNGPRPVSQRQQAGELKPTFCPPLGTNKLLSPRKPNDSMRPSLSPPPNGTRPPSQRQQTGGMKASLLPPLGRMNPVSPRMASASLKKARFPPRVDPAYSILAYSDMSVIEDFIIPSYFVSRFSFYKEDLGYLLFDGTVGFCFKDGSRVVMEPNEQFAHFYENSNTEFPGIIYLNKMNGNDEPEKISLVKKAARNFKKIRFSFDLEDNVYDPDFILHNINGFVKCDDSILFKLDGMNFQVNFNDHSKLIIFWNTKKLCFFRSFNEFCSLLDLKNVASMNSDSDELRKFKKAKTLLSELSLTIC